MPRITRRTPVGVQKAIIDFELGDWVLVNRKTKEFLVNRGGIVIGLLDEDSAKTAADALEGDWEPVDFISTLESVLGTLFKETKHTADEVAMIQMEFCDCFTEIEFGCRDSQDNPIKWSLN